jgi:microcystin-dependent protein
MANLTPTASFDDVYQFETTDPIEGGAGGIDNRPHQELLNRTQWLKLQADNVAAHRAQARSNVVLTGKYDNITGEYNALSAPASTTLRLTADVTFPFIYSASAGYDEQGEVTEIRRLTSNLEVSTSGLGNKAFLALVMHTGAGASELFYADEAFYFATPYEQTVGGIYPNLWYNTATNKSYWGDGGNWNPANIVVVGRFEISGGAITTVETFPYRQPYYDEETVAGTITAFAANKTPRGGFLACAGAAVSRLVYRTLFNAIGTTYGVGDGSTTFNLPDLRGRFVRGIDDGAGHDAGRVFGTTQADEFKAHNHTFTDFASNVQNEVLSDTGGSGGNVSLPDAGTAYATNSAMNNTGGTETRPKNIAMRYYIKY